MSSSVEHRRATAARLHAFWLPCPVCREEFGGHEWRGAGGHDSCIPELDNPRSGTGICPSCTAKGIGCYAQARLGDGYSVRHDCAETRRGLSDRGEDPAEWFVDSGLLVPEARIAPMTRYPIELASRRVSVKVSRSRSNLYVSGLIAGLAVYQLISGIVHGSWLSFVLAGMSATSCWLIANWSPPTPPIEPEPAPPVIQPIDQDDPFCTCPKCGLLGNHEVRVLHPGGIRRIPSGPDGDSIEIGSWATPTAPFALRTCWLCAHEWRTSAT